jgi:hypothetical protein
MTKARLLQVLLIVVLVAIGLAYQFGGWKVGTGVTVGVCCAAAVYNLVFVGRRAE